MENNSHYNGSFRYSLEDFKQVSIVLGDRSPFMCKDRKVKFTAYWKGLDDEYLFNLMTILHLAEFCHVQVTTVTDDDENLKGISFEIQDCPTNKTVIIQKDDCGYIEVVDDKGEFWSDLSYIVINLTYEVHFMLNRKLRKDARNRRKEEATAT